jgi:hypothetical protein
MKLAKKTPLDFVIDKLTNSIENTSTGEVFDTVVVQLTLKDLSRITKPDNYSGTFKLGGQARPHFHAPHRKFKIQQRKGQSLSWSSG